MGQSAFCLKDRLQEVAIKDSATPASFCLQFARGCLSLAGTKLLQIWVGIHETNISEFVFFHEKKNSIKNHERGEMCMLADLWFANCF